MDMTTISETWQLKQPFRISSHFMEYVDLVTVTLRHNGYVGRGEAAGVFFLGETVGTMLEQLNSVQNIIDSGINREDLLRLLPAGGARNALDCALWDLEAKSTGQSIWKLTGISPKKIETAYTIGIDDLDNMYSNAAKSKESMLKVKIDSRDPCNQIRAVRDARPDARIIVDANQALEMYQLRAIMPKLVKYGVELVEQPLPASQDFKLIEYESPIPLCADESCLTSADVNYIAQRYQVVNIKLDKCGGLTEALRLASAAKVEGLTLMVGCMVATSLSQAPAFVVGQLCKYVDIDGPLLLASDCKNSMVYKEGLVCAPEPALWG